MALPIQFSYIRPHMVLLHLVLTTTMQRQVKGEDTNDQLNQEQDGKASHRIWLLEGVPIETPFCEVGFRVRGFGPSPKRGQKNLGDIWGLQRDRVSK